MTPGTMGGGRPGRDLDECCSGRTVNIYSVRSRPGVAARCTATGRRAAEASAELEVRHQYPNAGAPGPAATVFLGVPGVAGGVRHLVDESKTKPTYSASTIAASVIPAHGPPRCRRPRPNQDRPPSAPAAQHGSQLLPIGFLGAYTTSSTMAMDGVRLLDQGWRLATGWRRHWWGRWPRCGEDRRGRCDGWEAICS